MTMIILLTPEDTPIIDTISAHNQKRLSTFPWRKRYNFTFSKNLLKNGLQKEIHKENLKAK